MCKCEKNKLNSIFFQNFFCHIFRIASRLHFSYFYLEGTQMMSFPRQFFFFVTNKNIYFSNILR